MAKRKARPSRIKEFEKDIRKIGAGNDMVVIDLLETYKEQRNQIEFIGKLINVDRAEMEKALSGDESAGTYKSLDDRYERHSRMFNSVCGTNDKTAKALVDALAAYRAMAEAEEDESII